MVSEERCGGITSKYQYLCLNICTAWHTRMLTAALLNISMLTSTGPGPLHVLTSPSSRQGMVRSRSNFWNRAVDNQCPDPVLRHSEAKPAEGRPYPTPTRETRDTRRPARHGKEGVEESVGAAFVKDSDEQPIHVTTLHSWKQPCSGRV